MPPTDPWEDDIFQRKSSAVFLTGLIEKKVEKSLRDLGNSLCIAVDGEWGAGKTTFMERWSSDLENLGHPVIRFDAWKNDLSDEPLVGFIGAIKDSLSPWLVTVPMEEGVDRQGLIEKTQGVLRQAAKAAVPLGLSIAKGLAARYAGQQTIEILGDLGADVRGEKGTDGGLQAERAFEKFVEATLETHQSQKNAIRLLQVKLSALIGHIEKNTKAQLPVYVFVDELDRCRPDYALRLIEGVKHLFNTPGVCFIFTTNLVQLAEAVKAVYGSGFDGYKYLKRFFDLEYRLPPADYDIFAIHLMRGTTIDFAACDVTLRQKISEHDSKPYTVQQCLAAVFRMFNLNPRSQRQVFAQAEAAASCFTHGETIHVFYLFCLAAVNHFRPEIIGAAAEENFSVLYSSTTTNGLTLRAESIEFHMLDNNGLSRMRSVNLIDLMNTFQSISIKNLKDLRQTLDHPDSMTRYIGDLTLQNSNSASGNALRKYVRLISFAGGIK